MNRVSSLVVTFFILAQVSFLLPGESEGDHVTTLAGVVRDRYGFPIPNVTVEVRLEGEVRGITLTEKNGTYDMSGLNYDVELTVFFSHPWTDNYTTTVTLPDGKTTYLNCSLRFLQLGGLYGKVTLDDSSSPGHEAAVHLQPAVGPQMSVFADVYGQYRFDSVPSGNCRVVFELVGYDTVKVDHFEILPARWNELNVTMEETEFDLSTYPADGDANISAFVTISILFTRRIDTASVDGETLILFMNSTGQMVDMEYVFAADDLKVLATPREPLGYDSAYKLHITTSITDQRGKNLPFNRTVSFTTETRTVHLGPESVRPENGDKGVPVNVTVTVFFREDIDPATLDRNSFVLMAQGDLRTEATMYYDTHNRTAILIPEGGLYYDTDYTVRLSERIGYVDPSFVFEMKQWSFRTERSTEVTGTVTGNILLMGGTEDMRETLVTLRNGETVHRDEPNDVGFFFFGGVQPGTWTLKIESNGYHTYTRTVRVKAGTTTDLDQVRMISVEEEQGGPDEEAFVVFVVTLVTIFILVTVIFMVVALLNREHGEREAMRKKVPSPKRVPPAAFVHEIRSAEEEDEMEDAMMDEIMNRKISKESKEEEVKRPRELAPPPGM